MTNDKKQTIKELLQIPWMGLRQDLVLHHGPIDHDGQRSWILEDPVRGNNFRLGYEEGELLYRLMTEPDPDRALARLQATTPLHPSPGEVAAFIAMLQQESLAILPKEEVIRRETLKHETSASVFQKLLQGTTLAVSFHVPVIRPDKFLTKTLPYISRLWTLPARWIYLVCGLMGLILTLQEIDLYFSTASYLFTPQGWIAFIFCLALLKIGHEFAHAYTTKSMGLHVRGMGIYFIVFMPLLYTDTTDAWKISDRRRRIWISVAGVFFELCVAGIALLFWALLPDGILRSLMFFLSGTSLTSSIFINLNPFMRFDGYYVLMELWGIDNLRPRAFAMLRYAVRRWLFDWQGPIPEIHPHRRGLVFYGFLAILYRLSVCFSIAIAAYYLFFPLAGLILLGVELFIFIAYPLWKEIHSLIRHRHHMGSKFRLVLTTCGFLIICTVIFFPLPRTEHLPCLLMLKGVNQMEAPGPGQITLPLPQIGDQVKAGDRITRINDDNLTHELQKSRFDLESVKTALTNLGSGGERGAYRNWLMAEEKRLEAATEKFVQASALLEIHAPADGLITDVNDTLYEGAFVAKGTYLFTIATPDAYELKAYVHEKYIAGRSDYKAFSFRPLVFGAKGGAFSFDAKFREKNLFPVHYLPNESLLDIGRGPIISVQDTRGRRPRDAYFTFTFDVRNVPSWLPHGMPSRIWMWSKKTSVAEQISEKIWKRIVERGLF